MEQYTVHGLQITIVEKPSFDVIGYTRFVKLDGNAIGAFLRELAENGGLEKLARTSQQTWVCLSGSEGHQDGDCRCTVCVEKSDVSPLAGSELYAMHAPESQWAIFEVGEQQSPAQLHKKNIYKLIDEIGYRFNGDVGFHLDNEHEWKPGKTMRFLLPVHKV